MSESKYTFDIEGGLDDVPDLPSFTPVPTGGYIMGLDEGFEFKEINDHPAFAVRFFVKSVEELKPENLDAGEEPPKEGDTCNIAFLMDNEIGAGMFKKFAEPLQKHTGISSFKGLMAASKGLTVLVAMQRVSGKGDKKDQRFNRIIQMGVL